MSLRSLESNITFWSRDVLKNPRLRVKDIAEWSTGTIEPREGEVTFRLEHLGVNVAVKKAFDKRPSAHIGGSP